MSTLIAFLFLSFFSFFILIPFSLVCCRWGFYVYDLSQKSGSCRDLLLVAAGWLHPPRETLALAPVITEQSTEGGKGQRQRKAKVRD